MKHFKSFLFFYLALFFISSNAFAALERQTTSVSEVLSGDTVRLKGGKTLRYTGVKAPPLQDIIPLLREYGKNSLEFNKKLVEGKTITIEWGNQIKDAQGNLLGFVFLEDGTFVNELILKEGQAKWRNAVPNTRYAEELEKAELSARRSKKGLWEKEAKNPYLESAFLGEKSTHIYHKPSCVKLENIPESSLVKFDSRVEAKAAGFSPCAFCKGSSQNQEDVF